MHLNPIQEVFLQNLYFEICDFTYYQIMLVLLNI